MDDILKTDFGLEDGLADISKTEVSIKEVKKGDDIATITTKQKHRVQILDPATGTGTFLAEVVSRIKERQQPGKWPKYVDEHLIPRIYGFEYMMAPYTIAHLKLDMLLNWWNGEKISDDHKERLNIYLTNSLDQTDLLDKKHSFATVVAEEANLANDIKHNAPVMVVIGNPPYSGESTNKSDWIMGLMEDYKKEPNTNMRLNEKNPKWINNDYCKFIRMAQDYVDRRGEGIVAYICDNSFLDNPTFRGMRWNLLKTFNKIFIINLHGNSKKKETALNGEKDENVFDITQGVSINIFVKTSKKVDKDLADLYYSDLYGSRDTKEKILETNSLNDINFDKLLTSGPFYFFVKKSSEGIEKYKEGFKVEELFKIYSAGVVTANDKILINPEYDTLLSNIENEYKETIHSEYVTDIAYRPFDVQKIYYDVKKVERAREKFMQNFIGHDNIGLSICKQFKTGNTYQHVIVSSGMIESGYVSNRTSELTYSFPLYLYHSEGELDFDSERKPNLDDTIWRTIENWVKFGQALPPLTASERSGELGFDAEPEEPHFLFPEDIFDYIYGVLHSPHYREKYKEFLKVDFPRIPYPKNADEFEHYKECGHQLRELHLMRNVPKSKVILSAGSGKVERVKWESGKVYINDTQYFDNVPEEAWTMYIGGYQPAQKWLKDRKDRMLNTEEIEHYEKIIRVLLETRRIMDSMDDPNAQVVELKQKVQELEHQLQAKTNSEIHYHINAQNISLQTEGTINIGEINDK